VIRYTITIVHPGKDSMAKASNKKSKIIPRSQISDKFRWDIDSLYEKDEQWQKDCLKIEELLSKLLALKPNFTREVDSFLKCLQLKDKISTLLQKIYTYAHMRKDEDNNNNIYQSFFYQASTLLVKAEESLSFIEPGILSLEQGKLKKWLQGNKQLKVYQHYLEDIYRKKEHILSPEEERIISRTGEMAQVFEYSFELLSYADLSFPKIRDKNGIITPITHSNFITLLRNKNREFRKKIFQGYYQTYQQHRNIYATLLAGSIKKDQFYSSIRKYKDSLEAALFKDNIPVKVYSNLLDLVHQNIHFLHKYMQLKCDYLDLDRLRMYDMYAPLIAETLTVDYPEAQNIILESLKPLGEVYLSIVKEGFRERWIDVYENEGKTSGAYSTGSYRSKPYILMNYQGTLEDVFTLTHELGHSVHSFLAHKDQPFIYSDISIFLAEIASTTNEVLLTYYLLSKLKNKREKIIILNHFLEQFRTTFFRQAMFAEFELLIHQAQEKGEALTADFLCQKYIDSNQFYYGENVIIDRAISMEWARIPHFFYHYYVYQYAIGFAVAIALTRKIIEDGSSVAARYLGFLKRGSSDYPISILKNTGIDPTSSGYLEDALSLFTGLLEQL
ncbi:MAG: oligoendopeptidase F, partial [Atribacterota bacterium]|nr:oligoendopeptidase F [Atribacterota bacterium]